MYNGEIQKFELDNDIVFNYSWRQVQAADSPTTPGGRISDYDVVLDRRGSAWTIDTTPGIRIVFPIFYRKAIKHGVFGLSIFKGNYRISF